jgi:aldose 1-epimerase
MRFTVVEIRVAGRNDFEVAGDVAAMHVITTRPASVCWGTRDGFDTVTLSAGGLDASFVPGVGMAGVSLRHDGEELLDRRAGLSAYAESGAVMGIPLLHPWANRLAGFDYAIDGRTVRLPAGPPLVRCEEHGLPIHGLLNGSPHWRVRSAATDPDHARLSATLAFDEHPELLAAFPFPHVLRLDAALDTDGLTIATTLTATGDVPVPVAFGFHPYLRLPGVDRSTCQLRLPARRSLFNDVRGIPSGHREDERAVRLRLGARSFDDGFDGIADGAEFGVTGGGRRLTVTFVTGYPAAQIFSPSGARFVCFEPMTAPTNALRSGDGLRRVAPGAAFTATFGIAVTSE